MIVPLASELGQWLAGVAMALSLIVLAARRPAAVLAAYAAQAVVIACAAGWQAWLQASPQLALAGLLTIGAKGVGLPSLLRPAFRSAPLAAGGWLAVAPGVALAALAVAVAPEDLASPLAIVLLGLLTMVIRRARALRAMGLLSLENGVALAVVGAAGLPMILVLLLASLGVTAWVAAHLAPSRSSPSRARPA